jgi:hypothetical protein
MLVLSSIIASHYYNCCADGSTSPGNYGYPSNYVNHVITTSILTLFLSGYDARKDRLAENWLKLKNGMPLLMLCNIIKQKTQLDWGKIGGIA